MKEKKNKTKSIASQIHSSACFDDGIAAGVCVRVQCTFQQRGKKNV